MTDTPPRLSWTACTPAGRSVLDAVAHDPAGTMLALDFDGTLAPIVDDPTTSRILPESRQALARMCDDLAGCAIVTGRPVDDVRRMAEIDSLPGLERLVVLGQYGVERYDAATGQVRSPEVPDAVRKAVEELRSAVDELVAGDARLAGLHVEDKGRAVALHTRRAADRQVAWTVASKLADEVATRRGLHAEEGREVIELTGTPTSKARALSELIDERHPRVVLMAGDDLGDVPALDLVGRWIEEGAPGARIVSYSAEQPALAGRADVLCDGPHGVAAFLREVANRVDDTW